MYMSIKHNSCRKFRGIISITKFGQQVELVSYDWGGGGGDEGCKSEGGKANIIKKYIVSEIFVSKFGFSYILNCKMDSCHSC